MGKQKQKKHKKITPEVVWMKIENMVYRIKSPCSKCLYKLGIVHTFKNPCLPCRENGYQMFEWFQNRNRMFFQQEIVADDRSGTWQALGRGSAGVSGQGGGRFLFPFQHQQGAFHLMLLNPLYLSVLTEGGSHTRSKKRFLADSIAWKISTTKRPPHNAGLMKSKGIYLRLFGFRKRGRIFLYPPVINARELVYSGSHAD